MTLYDILLALFTSSVVLSIPILYGTTGEIIMEKSGSLNLGVEGMMSIGAIVGYLAACNTDSVFIGMFSSFMVAALCGLLFAVLTVTLRANQNVTGLAITMFGVGLYKFIGESVKIYGDFPFKSAVLAEKLAEKGIPGLRDIPYIGEIFFSFNPLVYIGIAIAIIAWVYLRHSRSGLRLNAVGENPGAADAVGINVIYKKYMALIIGSGITGIGGFYMGIINQADWNGAWVNGYGWISIALVIFANWNTFSAIFGSLIFGILMYLRVKAVDLILNFPDVFGWMSALPPEFYQMLPFLLTVVVLVFNSFFKRFRSGSPAALGLNYFREER